MDLKAAIAYVERELALTVEGLHHLKERMKVKTFRDSESNENYITALEEQQVFYNFILPKLREELEKISKPTPLTPVKPGIDATNNYQVGVDIGPVNEAE